MPARATTLSTATALDLYFDRIVYRGGRAPELATLRAVVSAHVGSIAFENIDVQLGRRVVAHLPAIFEKLVIRRRGGWCYEQNGLLEWVLRALGFVVTRVAGGVMRVEDGDSAIGNHLALIVSLEHDWLVDVGFGGSLSGPIPLAGGWHEHPPYKLSLNRQPDGYWRFEEWLAGTPFSWDFQAIPADEALIAAHLVRQQTDPASPFVRNLVVQRRDGDTHWSLRGRVLTRTARLGQERQVIGDASELARVLRHRFALDVPEVATIWPKIVARHQALFGH